MKKLYNHKKSDINDILLDSYERLLIIYCSKTTINSYLSDLTKFKNYLKTHNKNFLNSGKNDFQDYLDQAKEQGITNRTLSRYISSLKSFYKFLVSEEIRKDNPVELLHSPKFSQPLPISLSVIDVEKILNAPDIKTTIGLRDRAMLELLYSSGARVSELVQLELSDLNLVKGYVKIIGKGDKERLARIGEEAYYWLSYYINDIRPKLLRNKEVKAIFLNTLGNSMTRFTFWRVIKKYVHELGMDINISPHTLRHAFATHLVNNGAGIRTVQLLLGHSSLSTTQIYTHVAIDRLKQEHLKHHPRG